MSRMFSAYRCNLRAGPEDPSSEVSELPTAALTSAPGDGEGTGGLLGPGGQEPLTLSASDKQLRGLVSMLR